jgi:hypothetical protein
MEIKQRGVSSDNMFDERNKLKYFQPEKILDKPGHISNL